MCGAEKGTFLLSAVELPRGAKLLRVSVNIEGGAGLRARQYGPMAATEGRPTGLPTFLTPTPGVALQIGPYCVPAGPQLRYCAFVP